MAKNTLPTVITKISTLVFPDLVFKSITYKDFDEKLFKRKVDITPLFDEIISHVKTKKKHITFDYKEFTPIVGEASKTSTSTDWHVDGFDNEYYIVCFGKNRTEFLTSEIKLIQKKDLWLKNYFINKSVKEAKEEIKSFEALNGVLYKYDSRTVHRGREVEVKSMDEAAANGRVLVRICCSDYITAKNHIKR